MAKITAVMQDLNKVEEGVWVDYSLDIRFKVANVNSPKYKTARNKILKPHTKRMRRDKMDMETTLGIIKPAVAKHLLLDWENIEDENGKAIAYSPEAALEFFRNPALSDMYNFVLETAGENETFLQEVEDDSAKN